MDCWIPRVGDLANIIMGNGEVVTGEVIDVYGRWVDISIKGASISMRYDDSSVTFTPMVELDNG